MDNIKEFADKLAKEIEQSQEYKKYLEYKVELEKNSELKDLTDYYKKIKADIEIRRINGETVSSSDEKLIEDTYSKVCSNELCRNFINSEKMIVIMISDVYKTLVKNISLDMEFFDKMN